MITRTSAFVTSDNQTFVELDAAIGHELALIFPDDTGLAQKTVVEMILKNRDKIVDLLTTTPKSKTRARAVNGGTKKRKPAAATPGLADIQ